MSSDEVVLRRSRPPGSRPLPGPGIVRPTTPPPGPFETWAQLDPTGVMPRLVRAARGVPGVSAFEQRVVAPLESRLLEIAAARARALLAPGPPPPPPLRPTPQTALRGIVEDAVDRTPDDSRDQLYVALLDRLVADEVRILAALAEPRAYPVIHLSASRRSQDTPLVRNASTVGAAAGVTVPERTPHFIANLVHLGLARLDPEEASLADGYRRLLAAPELVAARTGATGSRWRRLSVQRRTLRITDFGRELWQAAQPLAVTVTE